MTFPTGQSVSTANVASPDSDPSLAREDIYNLIVLVNQLVASVNAAQGVLVLGSDTKIANRYLPETFTTSLGSLALNPANGIVSIQKVLRLGQIYVDDLGGALGTDNPTAGDICYLVDGDAGQPCISVYDGTKWRIIRLMTEVGSAGADITATFALAAAAD